MKYIRTLILIAVALAICKVYTARAESVLDSITAGRETSSVYADGVLF